MTPTATPAQQPSSLAQARTPRRLSPEFAELLHMLSSLDAKPMAGNAKSSKD
jgi:hypothetical protein